jgi:hypothetical protein
VLVTLDSVEAAEGWAAMTAEGRGAWLCVCDVIMQRKDAAIFASPPFFFIDFSL